MRIYQKLHKGSGRSIIGFDKEEDKVSTLTGYPAKLFDRLESGNYCMIDANNRVRFDNKYMTMFYTSGMNNVTVLRYIGDASNTEELTKLIPQDFV